MAQPIPRAVSDIDGFCFENVSLKENGCLMFGSQEGSLLRDSANQQTTPKIGNVGIKQA